MIEVNYVLRYFIIEFIQYSNKYNIVLQEAKNVNK